MIAFTPGDGSQKQGPKHCSVCMIWGLWDFSWGQSDIEFDSCLLQV